MIVVLKHNVPEEKRNQLINWLRNQNIDVHPSLGEYQTVLGLVGDTSRIDMSLLESLDIVDSVKRVSDPFKCCNRKFHPDDTVVSVGDAKFGGGHFAMIAGPCSVESEEQIVAVAQSVKAAGAQVLRGTAAQSIALLLASVTIVYGSTMAVKEHHFKRRLAYSTVSNLSYIVLAASLMTQSGLTAALAHMLFHALIKITLFFCAGAVMVKTGRTQIEDLRGLSRVMPFTCAVYTVGAISLMGTPLLPGFVSKWLIGSAAIETGTAMGMVGVAALLISAVLTAIYLMGPAMSMYFRPLEGMEKVVNCDPGLRMKLPFAVLTAAIVLCGLFSDPIITLLAKLSAGVM